MRSLQDADQCNVVNLSNERHEDSIHFRNKKEGIS
jgi:hypothetical protein